MDERMSRVLAEVWRGTEGYVFFSSKNAKGGWIDNGYEWPSDGAHELEFLDTPSVDRYFCPLVFSKSQRRAEYALPTHVLWADLDEADPRKCRLLPSIAWQTTQGGLHCAVHARSDLAEGDHEHWQALWLLGTYYPTEKPVLAPVLHMIQAIDAAKLSKRIAYAEPGADRSGWDVTQVLRLPGTLNHKHEPPQPVKLLWAKKLYYTVAQVREAYPPVPQPEVTTANGWPSFTVEDIAAAVKGLPIGMQMALERDDGGADRSLELLKLARELLRWKVTPEMAAALLEMSALGRSKYGARRDGRQRLLTTVADALLSTTTT